MFIKYRSLIYVFSYAPKILIVKLFPAVKWSTTVLGTYCVLTQCGNTMKNTEAGTFLQFWAGHVVARNKITFPSSLVARYGLVLWPLKNYEKGADSAVKGPFFLPFCFYFAPSRNADMKYGAPVALLDNKVTLRMKDTCWGWWGRETEESESLLGCHANPRLPTPSFL